ncbi:hypothetical protein VNO78_23603 [Psophocarpus tetragonolobus]|uniref:CLAVATA3/ESR (CLE)-related protein 13 n=1 Tax=Psophocarpus tetragonolobus TaxID=3891 RepID=A0AAN9S4A5_PSOTE
MQSFHFIMALFIRFQHLLSFILCLFLFSLLFHAWFGLNSNTLITTNNQLPFSLSAHRKILVTRPPFDFTPFLPHRHRHRHHHRHHRHRTQEPEIDPRYGVEKRLVPTGPNPLHH